MFAFFGIGPAELMLLASALCCVVVVPAGVTVAVVFAIRRKGDEQDRG
ncbi:MAG TPA: hypothetical protein VHC22_02960 [Pirellulales bacterium]|nr:hypothetical protein [Pirellulales bacterium]